MPYKILILGASYGSLLATKLLFGGQDCAHGIPHVFIAIRHEHQAFLAVLGIVIMAFWFFIRAPRF